MPFPDPSHPSLSDLKGPGVPDSSPRELSISVPTGPGLLAPCPPSLSQGLTLGGSGGGVSSAGAGLEHKDGVSRRGVWQQGLGTVGARGLSSGGSEGDLIWGSS